MHQTHDLCWANLLWLCIAVIRTRNLVERRVMAMITYDATDKAVLVDTSMEPDQRRRNILLNRAKERRTKRNQEQEAHVTFLGLFFSLLLCPAALYLTFLPFLLLPAVQSFTYSFSALFAH